MRSVCLHNILAPSSVGSRTTCWPCCIHYIVIIFTAAFKFAGLLFSAADYSENNNIKILCVRLEKRDDDDDDDNKSSNDLVLLFNSKQHQLAVQYCALDPS